MNATASARRWRSAPPAKASETVSSASAMTERPRSRQPGSGETDRRPPERAAPRARTPGDGRRSDEERERRERDRREREDGDGRVAGAGLPAERPVELAEVGGRTGRRPDTGILVRRRARPRSARCPRSTRGRESAWTATRGCRGSPRPRWPRGSACRSGACPAAAARRRSSPPPAGSSARSAARPPERLPAATSSSCHGRARPTHPRG